MSDTAIDVRGLGKLYHIGARRSPYKTLRESVVSALENATRNLKNVLVGKGEPSCETTLWALRDVSFQVARGEAIGIIGRNGAGKSTLLKILSRITEPTEGLADLIGRVASLLEVGTGFHPELTGRENIYLNGAILGMRKAELDRQFDAIVAFADVDRFLDTPVKFYSSGMHMRLAFSVAAHLDPDILVVDEVLAVGDGEFQKKCLGKMADVARSGRTVLFVSHNMLAVRSLTTRALWLEDGHLKMDGPSAEVVDRYLARGIQQYTFDVEQVTREFHHDMDVRFVRVELARHENGHIKMGEDISVDLTVKCRQAVEGVRVSFTIFSAAGVPVGSGFSRERYDLQAGETATFRLELAAPSLAPGRYYHGFAVGRGDPESGMIEHDVVIGYPEYEVVPSGRMRMWGHGWGAIVFEHSSMRRLD